MSLLTAPTFIFAPGDTWTMPVTYCNPGVNGAPGTPIDLTGATASGILFARGSRIGIALTAIVATPTTGAMLFSVAEAATAALVPDVIPPFADHYDYPTRLQVRVRDTAGNIETIAVFPIQVFDPRTVDPASFPTTQAGTVVAGAPTSAAVAAMIAAALVPLQTAIAALQAAVSAPITPTP
jgi:hypothetical protein